VKLLLDENKNNSLEEENETLEGDQLIAEALILEAAEEGDFSEDDIDQLISENLLSERNIVRLDKKARKSHAIDKSVLVLAKENNDPLYKRLVKNWKQRRMIRAKLKQKYGSKAIARARKIQSKSRNKAFKKVASKISLPSVFKSKDIPHKK
jgi:hypothetical protein